MNTTNRIRRTLLGLCTASALAMTACATDDPRKDFIDEAAAATANEEPFGGEALAQRKLELERAVADLGDFLDTLTSMKDRGDETGIEVFRRFIDRYLITHVGPLLAPKWQSHHPELIRYDANLRFVQSELLLELRYVKWARDEIKELRVRYAKRGNMLVEYPAGEQNTLREALTQLRERAARG